MGSRKTNNEIKDSLELILELEAVKPGVTLQPRFSMFHAAAKGLEDQPFAWKDKIVRLLREHGCKEPTTQRVANLSFSLDDCFVKALNDEIKVLGLKRLEKCPLKLRALRKLRVWGAFECARTPDNALVVKHFYGPPLLLKPFMAMRYTDNEVTITVPRLEIYGRESTVPLLFGETIEKLGGSCEWGFTSHPSLRREPHEILTIQCRHDGLPPEVFIATFFYAAAWDEKEREAEMVYWKLRPLLKR